MMENSSNTSSAQDGDELGEYCRRLLSSLARSDQRRWGEVYVRGLLTTPGRKTLAAIAERAVGRRAVQPLQQFLNQSPWDHSAVRGSLGRMAAETVRPLAWAVDETVFPKNGAHSVGVARQFVPGVGRTVNCQLGLTVSLVGENAAVPVNWRLQLPKCWDHDLALREKAHLPSRERHRPRWQHVLDALDELIEDWHLPAAPVLVDCTAEPDIEPLLSGLEARGLGYVVDVVAGTAVRQAAGPISDGASRSMTAAQCVQASMLKADRVTIYWAEGPDRAPRHSQFVTVPVPGLGVVPMGRTAFRTNGPRPRLAIAEWPVGRLHARRYWITNLAGRTTAQIVTLAKLRSRSGAALGALHTELGLGDFEGRSFRGWHHHVTLVAAASHFQRVAAGSALPLDRPSARLALVPAA